MRNWNKAFSASQCISAWLYLTYEELKLFFGLWFLRILDWVVPYLWGIETKLIQLQVFYQRVLLLYLTYEELKPIQFSEFICDLHQLYLTYEELKLNIAAMIIAATSNVVPYLWGIETLSRLRIAEIPQSLVVPYLWGIETSSLVISQLKYFFFVVPYLWGIETN